MRKYALEEISALIRHYCLTATTMAGSGHPTSSLSAADLMAALMFGGFFRYDADNPKYPNNDRLIFSKGHASPLFYALWAAAGKVSEKELLTLRKFKSPLEGHPTMKFRFSEAATGSLGQGLSVGVGMALNAKYLDRLPYKTFVLLGDSEMSEGSVWEAAQIASFYALNNLIGIIDVNGLGQRGKTMYGYTLSEYKKKMEAFGWNAFVVDGHSFSEITSAYKKARTAKNAPVMIIAKTIKGKGVKFLENKDGWHGKALSETDLVTALDDLGTVDKTLRGKLKKPNAIRQRAQKPMKKKSEQSSPAVNFSLRENVATRKAYGDALVEIFPKMKNRMVVLDAEVSNSTYAEIFKEAYPERFFEMYIAEQNMAGVALGLSRLGKKPFVSTFSAFFSRAYDQIRMSRYSDADIVFCGSHAGVSIGEDGPSQMGLEDIAMFRAINGSAVLYPSDAVSTLRLVEEAAAHRGISYIRTTRAKTPVIYKMSEKFPIGGCKVVRGGKRDSVCIISAGITLHEAIKAHEDLLKEKIFLRVIDLYSVKPIDNEILKKAIGGTKNIIVVEDHYPEGGIGEAVRGVLNGREIISLAVKKLPMSGKPQELLDYEAISATAIAAAAREML